MIISVSIIILLIIIIFNVLVFVNYDKMTTTMEIYLQKDITEEQLADIENVIKENASEVEIRYMSSEEHLNEMKDWLGEDGYVLEHYKEEDNPFKPSLIVKVKDNKDIQKIVETVENMPGAFKIYNNINTYINQNPYQLFLFQIFNG